MCVCFFFVRVRVYVVGYLLSKKEQKCGTPERPLSALGAIGYKRYWTLAIMRYLQDAPDNPRLEGMSDNLLT